MALADILVHRGKVSLQTFQTDAGDAAIAPGEPVKLKAAGSPYVIALADNEPVIGTTTQVRGVAASASTHTSTADGTINVYVPDADTEWEAKPTTLANANTAAEIKALEGDRVLFDLTGTTFTVDENAGDTATSGIQITGGDPDRGKIYFKFRPAALEGPVA